MREVVCAYMPKNKGADQMVSYWGYWSGANFPISIDDNIYDFWVKAGCVASDKKNPNHMDITEPTSG